MRADEELPVFLAVGEDEEPVRPRVRPRTGLRACARFRAGSGLEVLLSTSFLRDAYEWGAVVAPLEGVALLAGARLCDEYGEYVFIVGFVPDDEAIATAATVRTTARSEAVMRERLRESFPEAEAIGWLHPHPGYGAFFSRVDRETQASWREPHQLGIVIDPLRHEIAVFRGPTAEEMFRLDDEGIVPSRSIVIGGARIRREGLDLEDQTAPRPTTGEAPRPGSSRRGLLAFARRLGRTVSDLFGPLAFAAVIGAVLVSGVVIGRLVADVRNRLARIEARTAEPRVVPFAEELTVGDACGAGHVPPRTTAPSACYVPACSSASTVDEAHEVPSRVHVR